MRAPSTDAASLVVAAQAGDRRALEELLAGCLPMVYNIVGRALSGHPDADDVVQETMLRAIRELRSVRAPASFRPWLAAIAVHQVSTHLRRRRVADQRTAALDEAAGRPDAGADFEDLTILCLGLSGQRRQAVLATRWLDADHRALLALWWLETAGQLTRPELAAAMGVSVAHAGVRVQRMLDQFELSRAVVAALSALPRCADLGAVAAGWDGRPSPLWRKRVGRHVRACAGCARAGEDLVPAAGLLIGIALVPVPVALTAALLGKGAVSGSAAAVSAGPRSGNSGTGLSGVGGGGARPTGLLGQLAGAVGAHPVAAVLVVIAVGAVVAVAVPARLSRPAAPAPAATAAPVPRSTLDGPPASASPGPGAGIRTVAPGPVSLESANEPGRFVARVGDRGVLAPVGPGSAARTRQAATFEVTAGLADPTCLSLRSRDGRYLRHSSWRLRLMPNDGTTLFREDATFCPRPGATPDSVALESFNFPGRFLRHVGDALWVDPADASASFDADSSFRPRPPFTR